MAAVVANTTAGPPRGFGIPFFFFVDANFGQSKLLQKIEMSVLLVGYGSKLLEPQNESTNI